MFPSLFQTKSQYGPKVLTNTKRRKNKKLKTKTKKNKTKKNSKLSSAMSSWAENFTMATTWQLKHQVAYWKARAISLQYENNVLHEIIRRSNIVIPPTKTSKNESKSNGIYKAPMKNFRSIEIDEFEDTQSGNDTDYNETESESDDNVDDEEDFEVSEEFIEFLTANAKYKEDARRERERLKAISEEEKQAELNAQPQSIEQKMQQSKDLYGDKWQTIVSLETSLTSDFINELDKYKPKHWPNIPFNFNSS